MRRLIITGILALITGVTSMMAQGQLQVKSKAEAEAVQALGNAQSAGDSDAIIKAAEDLLTKFADTQFKEMALALEADAWRRKGDAIKAQVYGERVLEVNPKSIQANLMLAEVIVQGTGDRDLDKEEKLAKAEKYLNTTLDVLKTAPKPNPQVTDQEWAESKQFITAQARNDFGMIALSRKKYDDAIAAFQQAIASDPQQAALPGAAGVGLPAGRQVRRSHRAVR